MYQEYALPIFQKTLNKLGVEFEGDIIFEIPKNKDHGDLSTNIAMQLARVLKKAPRVIAQDIVDNLDYDNDIIVEVSIAGAGFINIKFSENFFSLQLDNMLKKGADYGKLSIGKGTKVNVEYVSANPTGLLHLGHGRNACIGDSVANLYEWCGYEVTREYYFNNAGNQMNNLAKSIHARYMQLKDPSYPMFDDAYHGAYVKIIAQEFFEKYGEGYTDPTPENLKLFKELGEKWCFAKIKATLNRMNIIQDVYYNENSLYEEGKIAEIIEYFKEHNLAYEKDGALWMKLSELGQEDDRVIVKSSGEPTYRLPDMAYHREKFRRGFDLMIDVFGADHIATVPDVLSGVKALGYNPEKVNVLLHQFVTLTENGQQVKMSKRTGKSYTLDDLLDEVGEDVVRFFLLMRGIQTHLEFDLSLAKEQSDKNPVFYLQYAHARISSIFEKLKENEIAVETQADLQLLVHQNEKNLIKTLMNFEKTIQTAANKFEPHIMADYLRKLASDFHLFYHDCRIIGVESGLMQARIKLLEITKYTMYNGLKILGVSAPERM